MTLSDIAGQIAAARQAISNGDSDTAAAIAMQILAQAPDCLDALEIKALVEIERGADLEAEQTLRLAITAAPGRRWPYGDLIRLLLRLGRADDAEAVARDALAADPENPDAHAMLGSMLTERGLPVEAAAHFQKAIALAGRHPQLVLGLGLSLLRQSKLQAARPLLEAAAAAGSGALEPAVYLAELEERLGRFSEAMRLLDRAEQIASKSGTDVSLQRSVLLERMGKHDQALRLLEGVDDLSGAALLQRGRLRDRLGRYDEAWRDWSEGKAKLAGRSGRSYPAEEVSRQADALAAFFEERRAAALPRAARSGGLPQPIFILGFPRSGTTLTEHILASHSAIRAGGELPFGRELRDLAARLAGGETRFPQGLREAESNWPVLLRDHYLARVQGYGLMEPGAAWFTDKMPLNDMWLPLLRLAFPDSPVVRVRRHPLDVLTSVMAHDMTHGFNCGYRLEDAARHLALIDRLIEHYREAGAGPTYELRYESLVADQEGETERLMASIGLEMEPAQLRFHERETVSPTPSYAQVREPLNSRSVERWRHHAGQLEPILPIVAEAMGRGGYAA